MKKTGYVVYRLNAVGSDRFYIGKTNNPEQRLKQHLRNARNQKKKSILLDWIRSHGAEQIVLTVVDGPYESEESAFDSEKKLIAEARANGQMLVNDPRTEGGENPPNHSGMKRRPETVEKMRAAVAEAMKRPDVRQRVSDGQRGRKQKPETIKKIRATITGKKHSPLSRENMRRGQLRRYARQKLLKENQS